MARKIKKRQLKERVLLVSEGKRTEQNYFKGLCQKLRISIEIRDINKTSSDSLLNKAKRIYNRERRGKSPFTQVVLIFDKDNFHHYEQSKKDITNIDNFYAFFSEPCFEYWLLLHFQEIKKPFNNCAELKNSKDFNKYLPKYKKNIDIFPELKDKLQNACRYAKNNPHTNINELVEYLQNIKNK